MKIFKQSLNIYHQVSQIQTTLILLFILYLVHEVNFSQQGALFTRHDLLCSTEKLNQAMLKGS